MTELSPGAPRICVRAMFWVFMQRYNHGRMLYTYAKLINRSGFSSMPITSRVKRAASAPSQMR